jgi:gliding motility-associated-like protein
VVDVVPLFTFFLPNAFTPNADGRNDVYRGAGIFFGVEQYEMLIFNRWGECVFESKDPYVGWNGQKSNTGFRCPAGVYPVVVHITGERGKKFTYTGVATLVE